MSDCLFCKIVAKEIDSTVVHESSEVLAFQDINPAAPTHVLVIPKRHIASAAELGPDDGNLLAEMFQTMTAVATAAGLERGHRIVTNIGEDAGQAVHHLHFHVLGGRTLSWPPG
ncbi:MAG: histidine triad nucleotide-binding protein [Actinomycetota bacterium]